MKKIIIALFLIAISFVRAEEKKFGKELSVKEKTSVSTILAQADKFEGKTVLIEGKILSVCQMKGCWIDIAGEKENEKIRVKVSEDEIVFPKDIAGQTVLVEGVVVQAEMKAENKTEKDCDKKEGASSEDDSCCSKEKVKITYQIQGVGAVIK